jgi:hypothetical protein
MSDTTPRSSIGSRCSTMAIKAEDETPELHFVYHVAEITYLLGVTPYAIHHLLPNCDGKNPLRVAWIVGVHPDDARRPNYDHDNIVSLEVRPDGTASLSMGSVGPTDRTKLYAVLGYCAFQSIECEVSDAGFNSNGWRTAHAL